MEDFLTMLAGLIPFLTETVLPALGVGDLSRLAIFFSNGLYLKQGGSVCLLEID